MGFDPYARPDFGNPVKNQICPDETTDLVKGVTPWETALVCHCGHTKEADGLFMCKVCGCENRFKPIKFRYEYDYEPGNWGTKNRKRVEWSGCSVEDKP